MASPSDSAHESDDEDQSRRDFLFLTAGAMGAVGTCVAAYPLIQSMNPAADTLAMSTIDVDLSALNEGQSMNAIWQGQPIFIRYRTQREVEDARAVPLSDLKDPETDQDRVKQSAFQGKDLPQYLILIGICTHLGCIPLGQKPTDPHGNYDGWFCPCHGSQYDTSGRIRKGPAPKNLKVPDYIFTSATAITIGKKAEKKTA